MSKSAFLDMLKSSSDKARTQEINKEQVKVISVMIHKWYRLFKSPKTFLNFLLNIIFCVY